MGVYLGLWIRRGRPCFRRGVLRRNAPNTPQTEIPGGPTAANAPRAETQTAPFIVQKNR